MPLPRISWIKVKPHQFTVDNIQCGYFDNSSHILYRLRQAITATSLANAVHCNNLAHQLVNEFGATVNLVRIILARIGRKC